MNINLPSHLEADLFELVNEGKYATMEDAIITAVQMLTGNYSDLGFNLLGKDPESIARWMSWYDNLKTLED